MLLTPAAVDGALSRVEPGLTKYRQIQTRLAVADVVSDRDFQRAFNAFYRVRRPAPWQSVFYELLGREKTQRRGFAPVLHELHDRLGQHEASFASKLVASVDPTRPVLDAFVLKNTSLALPARTHPDRLPEIVRTYEAVGRWYDDCRTSAEGRRALRAFDERFPDNGLTELKKLDLILWQIR